MRHRRLLLGAAIVAISVTSASAEVRIAEDRGGQIGQYLQTFNTMRSSGEHIVIDGNCLSACTLVLGVIPRSRMCATSRARFGFHAAWMPDGNGRPVTSAMGTRALWNIYPVPVRQWIDRHGGLSRKMIFLQGDDLTAIIAPCNQGPPRGKAIGPPRETVGPTRAEAPSRSTVAHHSVRRIAGTSAEDSH
jgi:hypothetical protein